MNFTPVVRNAHSIVKALLEFAKDRAIDIKEIEFSLLSYQTLIQKASSSEYLLVENTKEITPEDLASAETFIVQEYKIQILPKSQKPNPPFPFTLATNKLKTKAVLKIAQGTVIEKRGDLLKSLKKAIWEKKLKMGLLIDIFEPNLDAQLRKLLKILPYAKALPKELKFSVAKGIEPLPPVDAKLLEYYKQKDSSKESIIDGVDKDELIARYIKVKEGVDGRSCRGKYIRVREPKVLTTKPQCDANIRVEEGEECINYYAKATGYVTYEQDNLSISKTLQLEGADFKSTAKIDGGNTDRDISVHIAHKKSAQEDAISSGVKIDVKELRVDGAIGANVNIATEELSVDAQTHKNSKLEVSNKASVKLHRGDLSAKDAEVAMLEAGKVTASNSIHIQKMLGGEAIAPRVKVDELLSNSCIIASRTIEIETLSGEHNKLIINPDALESYHKEIEELKEKIAQEKKSFKEKESDYASRLKTHTERAPRIREFQERVLLATRAQKKPMKQDVIRIKQYKKTSQQFQEEGLQIQAMQTSIESMSQALESLYNYDLQGTIYSKTPYDGHTQITFVNPCTKEELHLRPEGVYNKISLTLNEKGERVILLDAE